jgi:formimidoylglutamate deiminase
VDDDGVIARVETGLPRGEAQALAGPVLPGMPNAHSHAFQRAMAGLTAHGGGGGDDFWSWRELMYRFLARLTPDDVEAIASELYLEMLRSGYTSVAEFHYLHHDAGGNPYADGAEMAQRILNAAAGTGIALTLLPVFYAHSNFGGVPATAGQRRFLHDVDTFNALAGELCARVAAQPRTRFGIAPHSLRAVTPRELSAIVEHARALDATAPIHIHAAEQQKEVDDSITATALRPVQWLLANAHVDARWCLVHATHLDAREIPLLATAGATVCVCPTTEGDLGDGIFPAQSYLRAGGSLAIGGDSHVGVDPFAELRLLEYGQRLAGERRNVLAREGVSVATGLWLTACAGGAQALGQPVGAIAAGRRADLVVLDSEDVALAGLRGSDALDGAVFGPTRRPVGDVMVAGEWVVRDGQHAHDERTLTRYRAVLKRLISN